MLTAAMRRVVEAKRSRITPGKRKRSRPQREAATRCNKKMRGIDGISYEIYNADIHYLQDAYQVKSGIDATVGDVQHGQLILASLPIPDPENGDFEATAIFANEDDKMLKVKATAIMQDVPDYLAHVKSKANKYDFVKDAIKAFEDEKNKKKDDETKDDETRRKKKTKKKKKRKKRKKQKKRAKIKKRSQRVCVIFNCFKIVCLHRCLTYFLQHFLQQEILAKIFKQQMIHVAHAEFYKRMVMRKVGKGAQEVKIFLDLNTFRAVADGLLSEMSNVKTISRVPGGLKYSYGKVDSRKFYELGKEEYCYKEHRGIGYFYIDNIRVEYNETTLWMKMKFDVVHWDRNGNHSRSEPPWL